VTLSFFHREFLLDGLTVLKNRGYDSAGMATMSSDSVMVRNYFGVGDTILPEAIT